MYWLWCLYTIPLSIFRSTLQSQHCYYAHFTDEKIKTQWDLLARKWQRYDSGWTMSGSKALREHSLILVSAYTTGFLPGLKQPWQSNRRFMCKTTAPVPTAFLPWKIAGLLWSVRQGSQALERDLGTLHRNQLFSRSPTFSDLQTLLKTQASRKVTRDKGTTVCFQQGCARIVPAAAKAITLNWYKITSLFNWKDSTSFYFFGIRSKLLM